MQEINERARVIRLLLTDCDGVLTDGGVYYGATGEQLKRFNIRDGMGVKRLRLGGVETGIVTGENSPSVVSRARKLGIEVLHLGIRDKLQCVQRILADAGLNWSQVAYIGDDVNDLPVLRQVGLAACPKDAVESVRQAVHWVLGTPGGHGAFREVAEAILTAQGRLGAEEFA